MKYLHVVLCTLFSASTLCAQNKSFNLKGVNSSVYNGYKVYLYVKSDNYRNVLFSDSTTLQNGKFHFSGPLTQPASNASIKLVFKDQQYFADFVLDTGSSQMNIKPEHLYKRVFLDVGLRSVSNILMMKIDSTDRKAYADQKAEENVKGGPIALSRGRTHDRDLKCLKAIESYPDNYYSLVALYYLGKNVSMTDYADLILETFHKLSPELKSTDLGRKLFAYQSAQIYSKEASKKGQSSPIFNVIDGQNRSFTNKIMLGQPHLLVFTATWCVPCQKQLPKLRKISETYGRRGLKIVYVSLDKDLEKWKRHLKTVPANWIHVADREERQQEPISKMFYVTFIPTYFLIDAAGKIAYNSDTTDPELLETEKYIRKVLH